MQNKLFLTKIIQLKLNHCETKKQEKEIEKFDSFCTANQESVEEIVFDKLRTVFMT